MSETVHYRGIATLVCKGSENCENTAKIILAEEKGILKKDDYFDTYIEQLVDEFYEKYFYHKTTQCLYELNYTEVDLYEEIVEAKYVSFDNSQIGFELKYYNGGAGFPEVLTEAIDNLTEND